MSAHLRSCPCCAAKITTYRGYRIFPGSVTKQVDARGVMAMPSLWYFEPLAYDGDILWSIGFPTVEEIKHYIEIHPGETNV